MKKLAILAALPLLSGCIVGTVAKTAVDVATIPVKVASAGVDAATTSQAEADQNRGREMRKEDERRGREARAMAERCRRGQALPTDVCTQAPPR
ncbi:MAG TPA: hypothetical protein VNS53_04985 [Sphingomicrobium sp.]|jgi:hypothetical protein|nr:hypothetical protein [Sphingomicrobium sp.]